MNSKRPGQVAEPPETGQSFPTPRYFQIHFEHIYQVLDELKAQLKAANHQLAQLQDPHRAEEQTQCVNSPVVGMGRKIAVPESSRAKRRS